jgi:hypothetical protein
MVGWGLKYKHCDDQYVRKDTNNLIVRRGYMHYILQGNTRRMLSAPIHRMGKSPVAYT